MGNAKSNLTPHRMATSPVDAIKQLRATRKAKAKIVSGVKLYSTWNRDGQHIWVTIPE